MEFLLKEFESKPIYFITLNPTVEAVKEREEKRHKKGYTTWDIESLHNIIG